MLHWKLQGTQCTLKAWTARPEVREGRESRVRTEPTTVGRTLTGRATQRRPLEERSVKLGKKLTFAAVGIGLLGTYAGVSGGEADTAVDRTGQLLDKAAASVEQDYETAATQHEDVIDRAFAPLDDTVADINRDLNKQTPEQIDADVDANF